MSASLKGQCGLSGRAVNTAAVLLHGLVPYLLDYKPGRLFIQTLPLTRRLNGAGVYSRPACIVLSRQQITEYQKKIDERWHIYCFDLASIPREFHLTFTPSRSLGQMPKLQLYPKSN